MVRGGGVNEVEHHLLVVAQQAGHIVRELGAQLMQPPQHPGAGRPPVYIVAHKDQLRVAQPQGADGIVDPFQHVLQQVKRAMQIADDEMWRQRLGRDVARGRRWGLRHGGRFLPEQTFQQVHHHRSHCKLYNKVAAPAAIASLASGLPVADGIQRIEQHDDVQCKPVADGADDDDLGQNDNRKAHPHSLRASQNPKNIAAMSATEFTTLSPK